MLQPVWVRINAASSNHQAGDIDLLKSLPASAINNVIGVVLPKVEHAIEIDRVRHALAKPMIALIETPKGMANIPDIAAAAGLTALSFGFWISVKIGRARRQRGRADGCQPNPLSVACIVPSMRSPHRLNAYIRLLMTMTLDQRVNWWRIWVFRDAVYSSKPSRHCQCTARPSQAQLAFTKSGGALCTDGACAFAMDGQMVDTPVIVQAQKLKNIPTLRLNQNITQL